MTSLKLPRAKFLLLLILSVWAQSCYYDNQVDLYHLSPTLDCSKVSAMFAADVNPIIVSKCNSCHSAAVKSGNLILETWDQVSAAKSKINTRVLIQKNMPAGGLSIPDLNIIQCWLNGGALNN